jgi:hypothetical protein
MTSDKLGNSVSLEAYVRQRQIDLGQELEQRKSVYLDVKYWIALREVLLGRQQGTSETELLSSLRDLVSGGKAFCPISDSTFAELLKQSDPRTRKATATLIDELSRGVSIIPFEMRVGTELAHLLHSAKSSTAVLHPVKHLIWSKLSYVLGFMHPTGTGFDKETDLALQKDFFNHMWVLSMSEMIERIGGAMPSSAYDTFASLASRLNEENARHSHELRSFQDAYLNEIQGVIHVLAADTAADFVSEMIEKDKGYLGELSPEKWAIRKQELTNLLVAAIAKEPTKDVLRTLHITACIHAYVRWNKGQQLKANDFFDFRHAAAAIGYCDVFLTERSMSAMVSAKHMALGTRYGCRVIADVEEAVEYVKELN